MAKKAFISLEGLCYEERLFSGFERRRPRGHLAALCLPLRRGTCGSLLPVTTDRTCQFTKLYRDVQEGTRGGC